MSPRYALLGLLGIFVSPAMQSPAAEPPVSAKPSSPKTQQSTRTDHYGDPLPPGVRFRLGTVRLRHDGDAMAVAWLPDGRTLASAGWDQTVRLWQIPGGKQLAKWDCSRGVIFSPEGRILACSGGERVIRFVEVATGKELRRIRQPETGGLFAVFPNAPLPAVFSSDGTSFAILEEKGIRLYAVDSGKEIRFLDIEVKPTEPHRASPPRLRFTPDGHTLIAALQEGLCCWNIATGAKRLALGEGQVSTFALSPDGKMLAAVVESGNITLRSWPAGKELRRLHIHEDSMIDVSGDIVLTFSPDGKVLASSETGTIRLWNPSTGERLRRFEGENLNSTWDLAFSPDSSLLASAGSDKAVIAWEVRARKSPSPLTGVGHWLIGADWAADGQAILTYSTTKTATLWEGRDGHRLRTLSDKDGSAERFRLGVEACRTRALLLQEVKSGRHGKGFSKVGDTFATFSPSSSQLAVTASGRILLLRKTIQGIEPFYLDNEVGAKEAEGRKPPFSVSKLTFSPDGRTLAACYSDHILILWDTRSGRPRRRLSPLRKWEFCRQMEFSPDSRLLVVRGGEGFLDIHLIESATGQQFRLLRVDDYWITSLAFAPNNRTIAVGGSEPVDDAGYSESVIRLWDLPTERQFHTLHGHRDSVRVLAFSPDGASLLSGGDDHTVLSWDIAAILRRPRPTKALPAATATEFWTDLMAKDAARAQRAVAELIQAPESALPLLEKALPPMTPAKMAQRLAWIADLDDEQFARRERAYRELEKIGRPAVPALRQTLQKKPSLEMRKRITTLLESITEAPPSPDELRTVRALQVLECIGTPEARRILEGLSRGAAEAELTQEAKASLQRLARRSIKP